VSPPGELGPPLPIPLTTSGGSDQNHFALQNRPSKKVKKSFFPVRPVFFEDDSGKTEMDFQKLREVFFQNGMKNKNLFHIFHRCHQLGESKPSFSPFFQVSSFSCFSPDFAGAVSASWR
jgi:hypothetical protein